MSWWWTTTLIGAHFPGPAAGAWLPGQHGADGTQALKLVLNSDVDAILCDLQMPELTGDLFYIEVGRARPHLLKRFIFITGMPTIPSTKPS